MYVEYYVNSFIALLRLSLCFDYSIAAAAAAAAVTAVVVVVAVVLLKLVVTWSK